MRFLTPAVLGLSLVVGGVDAQQVATARAGVSSIKDVKSVAVRVRTLVESRRLERAGFDPALAAAAVAPVLAKRGIAVAPAAEADAVLEITVVCAGPDTGTVGCSTEAMLINERAARPALWWASARHVYQRDGWAAMAAEPATLVRDAADEFRAFHEARTSVAVAN